MGSKLPEVHFRVDVVLSGCSVCVCEEGKVRDGKVHEDSLERSCFPLVVELVRQQFERVGIHLRSSSLC